MSKSVLYEINPEQLFEQKSIQEIEQVRIKLQHEIEKKREELRTMVGERYRDLLLAADTIAEMKQTASKVIQHVSKINEVCEKSKWTGFFKLQITNSRNSSRSHMNFSQDSVAAQIHILIIVPEKIWTAIENEDFLGAVELYLFARHISTGLQFRVNDDVQSDKKFNWMKLAERQWNMISTFNETIKNACNEALKCPDIKTETAVCCICTLCLLQDQLLSNILNTFINLRIEALNEILQPKNEQYNVKTKVQESANLLINTLLLVHECFIGNPQPLVNVEFDKMLKSDVLPVIKQLSSESAVVERVLGDDILHFRPSMDFNNTLSSNELNQAMKKWLQEVEVRVNKDLAELINLVNSVKSLQGIRHKLADIEKPPNWQEICTKLSVPDMTNVFVQYYQPLLTKRIQHLINLTWTKAIACIKTDIKKIVQKKSQSSNNQRDVVAWNYLENITDNKPAEEDSGVKLSKKVIGKTDNQFTLNNVYGFDNDMIKSCRMFDKCLKTLLDDVLFYLYHKDDLASDRFLELDDNGKMILKFLHDCSTENIKSLLDHIEKQYLEEKSCLTLSRYLNSVMYLCPNLSQCFHKHTESESMNKTEETPSNHVFNDITSLDVKLWQCWLDSVNDFIENTLDKNMPKELSARVMLKILSQWETVTIQEKDDEDKIIESNIRIPTHTSFPLQNILCSANAKIAQVGPHLMPNSVRKNLIKTLALKILKNYEVYSSDDAGYLKSNQVAAVQFYFDVRYLQTLTSGSARDVPGFQNVGDSLKKLIDPFDFDVFYPHLQRNIKRAVQKTQVQFGCLVGNPEQLNALLSSTPNVANQSTKQEVACILPLVTTQRDNTQSSYWFTLLPVTSTGNRIVEKSYVQQKVEVQDFPGCSNFPSTTTTDTKDIQQKPSTALSGAAAFFGAMGQDWFRTG
ncbi:conserved oligomeric Golgi complex subunit 1 [Ctenocephalides felis]|uniref:conserved oligomeric Golgi complex subunit 1 n=1 Tax=Ctenocephalides felis TaxID=7515 RepID=UPI000E6E2DD9|nr:conserved oligomeric Golgi complex subunit 1 [Ctenocephalides felis]